MAGRGTDVRRQPGFGLIAGLCLTILYAPILVLVIFAFNANSIVSIWTGVSLDWFAKALDNEGFHQAATNTMIVSITATIIATMAATAAALGTTRVRSWRGQSAAYMTISLPLMVPEIITAVATLSFFALVASVFGINLGLGNLIVAHTVFCIPFAYMPIRARLEDMDLTLDHAAADLYATPWMTFRRVTLPLLAPGIVSGAALAFIVSFDDFTISQLVAGPGQQTLPVFIWSMTRRPMTPELNAMCAILLGISILFISFSALIGQRRR
ncbi:ABC transporter permease [Chthonobacter albigriseus]|uniref:ABC transporter permease n=1 Tax=Chthonobacter albigriseus TaxID=1683161 RepID=UPI0015EF647E|nr:ABC transporter permease [Chthonobacter albigriseus]